MHGETPKRTVNTIIQMHTHIGGDYGAPTLATFVQYYQLPLTRLVGPSKGHHLAEVCYGILCPPGQYR